MEARTKINPWVIVFRVLFTLGMVLTIAFILSNSVETGAVSTVTSGRVLGILNRVMNRLGRPELTMHQVRKLAHFAEFLLLGFWMQLCLRAYTRHYIKHITAPALGCLLVACMDETVQIYAAGRSSSVLDVWLDLSGSVTGILGALMLMLFLKGLFALLFKE